MTVIDLCNMALGRIGAGRITGLTEESNEAIYCNLWYEHTRNEVLRSRAWKSATETQALAQLSSTPLFGWQYQYSMPTDPRALRIISVYPKSKFERQGRKILSDESTLSLKFVAEISDPNDLDEILAEVIALRLASKLATAVANDKELSKDLVREYLAIYQLAKQADGADSYGDDLKDQQDESTDLIVSR